MLYSLLAVAVVSLVSIIGILTISVNSKTLSKITYLLISLAAGTFIGNSFFHIIPEAYHSAPDELYVSVAIVTGILAFFILDKLLHWQHCHEPTGSDHPHALATSNLVADALHNLIDGVVIAAAFSVSPALGITTTIAVILHEIPQEIGDFGVLIYSGLSRKRALAYNFLSALAAFVGVGLYFLLGELIEDYSGYFVAAAAGGFIYIAISDLLPAMKHEDDTAKSIKQLIIVILGIVLMFFMSQNEALHAGHDEHDENEIHQDDDDHDEEDDHSDEE